MTAYQRIRRPPLLLPISPRIYIPARVVLRAGRAYSRLPSITLFVVTCCLLPNCCLLPTACCLLAAAVGSAFAASESGSGRFDLKSSTHCSCPRARPLGREGPVVLSRVVLTLDGGLCVALCFAIAACSPCFAPPCHAFCHRRLQLCSTSVGEPPPCVHVRAQHALAARTSVHELLPSIHSYSTLTPPCNQHLPIADCLVSPSSMYFLALAPLPIRSLAIHCYQLPAGLLATTTLFGCCLQRTMLHHHRLHFASQLAMIRCLHFNSRTTLPVACFTSPSPPAARYASSAACCASSTPSTARLTPPAQLAMLCHRHVQ